LRRYGGGDGVAGTSEGGEERVPLRVDLVPFVRRDRRTEDLRVLRQDRVIPLPQLLKQTGRSLDVGEEERDGACGAFGHRPSFSPRCDARLDWTVSDRESSFGVALARACERVFWRWLQEPPLCPLARGGVETFVLFLDPKKGR